MSEVRRTQVYLEPSIYELLRREAFAARKTLSACLRDILARHFNVQPKRKNATEALLELAGICKGGPSDMSERHDDYLAEAFYDHMMEKRREYEAHRRKERQHAHLR